jgi:hypothetical protein
MMSEPERRNTWREILGIEGRGNDRRARSSGGRRFLRVLWGVFIASVLLGAPSGSLLLFSSLNWLINHIFIAQVLSDFVIASFVILWGVFFASVGAFASNDLDDEAEKKAFMLLGLSLLFVFLGIFPVAATYDLPQQLWAGLHNPFSPDGVDITPVATSTGNATGLYLVTLYIKVNGLPPNATLIIINATFYNPFTPVKCVLYRTNVNSTTLPLTVHIEVYPIAWVTNIDHVDLTFLCNNIPIKSVLTTNYGNFTYSYPS